MDSPEPKSPFGHSARIIAFAVIGAAGGLALGMPNAPVLVIPGIVCGLVAEAFTRIFSGLTRSLGLPRTLLLALVPALASAKAFADVYFLRAGGGTPAKNAIRDAFVFGGSQILSVVLVVAGIIVAVGLARWCALHSIGRSGSAWGAVFVLFQVALTILGAMTVVAYAMTVGADAVVGIVGLFFLSVLLWLLLFLLLWLVPRARR